MFGALLRLLVLHVLLILVIVRNAYAFASIGSISNFSIQRRQETPIVQNINAATSPSSKPLDASASSEDVATSKDYENEDHDKAASVTVTVTGVTLKMAFDANFAVADMAPPSEKSERFTCPSSLDLVHKLRRNSDAVLVGRGTVVQDDCTLTVRRVDLSDGEGNGRSEQPARVVIDPQLKILDGHGDDQDGDNGKQVYKLLCDGYKTIIYHSCRNYEEERNEYENVKFVQLNPKDDRPISAKDIIHDLQTNQNIHHIMVEGGPATAIQFLSEGMIDRAMIFKAPSVTFVQPMDAGMRDETLENAGLVKVDCKPCGDDFVEYWVRRRTSSTKSDDDSDADIDEWPGKSICIERGWPY